MHHWWLPQDRFKPIYGHLWKWIRQIISYCLEPRYEMVNLHASLLVFYGPESRQNPYDLFTSGSPLLGQACYPFYVSVWKPPRTRFCIVIIYWRLALVEMTQKVFSPTWIWVHGGKSTSASLTPCRVQLTDIDSTLYCIIWFYFVDSCICNKKKLNLMRELSLDGTS